MSVTAEMSAPVCAFCATDRHHGCRPDLSPCSCAQRGHPGRGEGPRAIEPVAPAGTDAEARERLAIFRDDCVRSGDDQTARTLDYLLRHQTPLDVYRVVFAELEREEVAFVLRYVPPMPQLRLVEGDQ